MLKKKLKVEFQNYVGLLVLFFSMMVIFAVVGAKAIAAISLLFFYATAVIYPLRLAFLGSKALIKAYKERKNERIAYKAWKEQSLANLKSLKSSKPKEEYGPLFVDTNDKKQMDFIIGVYGEDYLYRQGILKYRKEQK